MSGCGCDGDGRGGRGGGPSGHWGGTDPPQLCQHKWPAQYLGSKCSLCFRTVQHVSTLAVLLRYYNAVQQLRPVYEVELHKKR